MMEDKAKKILKWVDENISNYLSNPVDYSISDGNVAICIVDKDGNVEGKMYGDDQNRKRQSYAYAWQKASQVWITGLKTGEFEKKVYANEIDEGQFGIMRPHFIGWEGGQPVALPNGDYLAVAMSGCRGETDVQIITDALKAID